ncbi:MAG: hypothetical protein MK234_08920, partial [Nitrospinales bacterium]|nr:hypothetical protein [Nitrospinales bacterium]
MMIRLLCITIIFFGFNASYIIQTTNASPKLGKVEFPTSGATEAQQHFIRGVAALHSFWYTEAIDSFQKSTRAAPTFAMRHRGEATAHNA